MRIIQRHPHIWRFLIHLRNEEAIVGQKILKANLGLVIPSLSQPTSKKRAAKKTMQIINLHNLLEQQRRTLDDVIISLSYLIGGPISGSKKIKQNDAEC